MVFTQRQYMFSHDLTDAETPDFDVVITGSGVAGLYTALCLDKGIRCAVLNKLGKEESNSIYAQGGVASVTLSSDSWQSHFSDTLTAGAGLCDEQAVKTLVTSGPDNIRQLMALGVQFDREKNGELAISTEGAHSINRILHCGGDATGYYIVEALIEAVSGRENITCFDNTALFDVLTDENGSVSGVVAQGSDGKYIVLRAPNVVIASGGIGRVYRNSTNAGSATGDGIAAAMRAGAAVGHMEFVQFHPTALIHPDNNMRYFLISEALRGEGAILRNRKWEPFLQNVHPMADLAPRDIVSRAIVNEMRKNDVPNVYLDITSRSREFLKNRFPVIYNECMKRGIDIAVNWIPVVPVQHYFMGGIKTDINGRTNIDGLYACGESACTGVHGANRLASNSLLECLVFGRRCAEDIGGKTAKQASDPALLCDASKTERALDFETYRSQIRNTMTKKGGIIRNETELTEAIALIKDFYTTLSETAIHSPSEAATLNMATVALDILEAAKARKKSVGAHYRSDDADKELII